MGAIKVIRKFRNLFDVTFGTPSDGDVVTYDQATDKLILAAPTGGPGGGAPTDATYLTATSSPGLSDEVVVGATPGGELGGTWASPTVDATHSGSSHAGVQSAAEATAAAALAGHEADTTNVHGIANTAALTTAAAALSAAQTEIADQRRVVSLLVTDPNGADLTTGDGKAYYTIPHLLNGHNLVQVSATVTTVSSSGIPTVQIANVTQGADMLTTALTIDASEKTSTTAATAAVIDTNNDDVATHDEIRIDIDVSGTGAKGLIVHLGFEAP